MPVSPSSLLAEVETSLSDFGATETDAIAALAALHHLGRTGSEFWRLESFSEENRRYRRALVANELAATCTHAARQWPRPDTRLVDLAGAAADTVAREMRYREPGERWAGMLCVADAISHAVSSARSFEPLSRLPELVRIRRVLRTMRLVAASDAPSVSDAGWLDVPRATLSPDATRNLAPSARTIETIADLSRSIEAAHREGSLTLAHLLAGAAAAEAASRWITATAPDMPSKHASALTVRSWKAMQAAAVRFEDGGHRRSAVSTRVFDDALGVHQSLLTMTGAAACGGEDALLTARHLASHLPQLADVTANQVATWAERGQLLARARDLPRGHHVRATLRDEVVVVALRDVVPVIATARVAGRLSAALAVELDQCEGGVQPHPALINSFRASMRPQQLALDEQWTARIAARCATSAPMYRT